MKDSKKQEKPIKELDKINPIFKVMAHTIWCERDLPESLKRKRKRILVYQIVYALIITFACTLSFLALIKPGDDWKSQWEQTMKIFQISGLFIFIFDYIAHFITFPYIDAFKKKYQYEHRSAFAKYLISGTAIVIFLCIVSSLNVISYFMPEDTTERDSLKYLGALNIVKIFRLFLVLKLITPFRVVLNVFTRQKKVLIYVFTIILFLIVIFALLILNNEIRWLHNEQEAWIKANPEITDYQQNPGYQALSNGVVQNFFEALYFATITLTTIGYGDFAPHSVNARVIVMIISLLGIAIIAIPSGLIAGAFMNDLKTRVLEKKEKIPTSEIQAKKRKEEQEKAEAQRILEAENNEVTNDGNNNQISNT
ncbi:potassium channel family protein [Metamycoplasma neophronis]|uniref:Potassium channel family protein n=1 Tax=Metamycoplasma neophronis TaxID=872983 RepID=A0ABY2Z0N8_9BACT|nr:potassium channel family protein [Metamycoplasma neophronis]TPR53851.1 potassium channel family protein [Metamycoplasma neophronis]